MADQFGLQTSRRRLLATAAAGILVAACGRPAPATFDLSAPRDGLRRGQGRSALIVPEPTAIFALDSERIVVRQANGELSYLGGAQWSDRLPRLLQARIIQTFENMGRAAVGRPADRLAGSVQLLVDIRLFEASETTRSGRIELAAKLVSAATGRVNHARVFLAEIAVASIDGPGVTQALDQALATVLRDLTGWASALA